MTKEEWKLWFSGHWDIGGARKKGHEAPFPEEIPRRLIRMFSFPGDTVLDPFLGTGTTAHVALELGRNAIGYEILAEFAEMAKHRLAQAEVEVRVRKQNHAPGPLPRIEEWTPGVPDLEPIPDARPARALPDLHTVTGVAEDCLLTLETGELVGFVDLRITDVPGGLAYLRERVLKRKVFLRDAETGADGVRRARVILKNRISINAQLLKMGVAEKTPGR
jgi:hypothetical protein